MPHLTDMSLIERTIGRDGHVGRTDTQTTLLSIEFGRVLFVNGNLVGGTIVARSCLSHR
jgi:hypothetical protein